MVRFLSEYFFASTIARCLGGQLQDGELGDAQALAVMADITKAMRSRADASGTLSSTVSSLQRVWRAASPGERMLLPTLPRDDETKTGARAVAWAWGGWLEPPARDILLKYLSGVPGFIYRLSFVDPSIPRRSSDARM